MRWVIYGAGAIGGTAGARLAAAGNEVVLVARGAHLDAIRRHGLRVRSAEGDRYHPIPAVGGAAELDWRPDDTVVLAVKSMDTEAAVGDLAAHADPGTTLLLLQNGVANEPAALRVFAGVYTSCVMMPTSHLEPGVVVEHSAPVPGVLDLGRYPHGTDATAEALAATLRGAGYRSQALPDIMRWKYRKLLGNLGNAVEALCGRVEGLDRAMRPVQEEGAAVLRAAGIEVVPDPEYHARHDAIRVVAVDGVPRGGGSTWQSLARGTGAVEADHLNGEIVLLGRLHGVPTPANETARRLVNRYAREGAAPGVLTPDQFLAAIA